MEDRMNIIENLSILIYFLTFSKPFDFIMKWKGSVSR
jgi:hypothetical protein